VRLDLAATLRPVSPTIGEADALAIAAGGGNHAQRLGVDHGAGGREGDRGGLERADAAAQTRGKDLLELDERAHRRLLDAGHRRPGRGAQADGDRHGLVVVEQQRRHGCTGVKSVAARRAGERVDRIAELAETVDVAPDGAPRHAEASGELAARPGAAALKQGEEREQPGGGSVHRPENCRSNCGQLLT